jgi:hypothetical protein
MDGNANIFPTTAEAIMRDRKFRAGFSDPRAGVASAPDADGPGDIWGYERGWLFPASQAAMSMPAHCCSARPWAEGTSYERVEDLRLALR